MLTLAWYWLLALLPLPWLVRRWWPPAATTHQAALELPDETLLPAGGAASGSARLHPAGAWAVMAWALLVLALARPQWVHDPAGMPTSGRDLMLALDLSGSMAARDFRGDDGWMDRLTAIQAVAGEFIQRRQGDRIGLILFGRNAYLQTPLTFDHATVKMLLDEAVVGLAGQQTAIGDAIGLAVRTVTGDDHGSGERRVLVLLTAGGLVAVGELGPIQAAEFAAQRDLRIYTIGVGAEGEHGDEEVFGIPGGRRTTDLDEATLRRIAELTGGRYFRAQDTAGLEHIYAELDELEPTVGDPRAHRLVRELYPWPLAAALFLAIGAAVSPILEQRSISRGSDAG